MSEKAKTLLAIAAPFVLGALVLVGLDRAAAPDGESERERMVRTQLVGQGITHTAVLEAMGTVPRERFMPDETRHRAYADGAQPIGHGQTISQPWIVAAMTQALDPQPGDKVLEVGTGLGYQAAVLGHIVQQVHTIEILEPLCEGARTNLADLGIDNVHVHCGDGYRGLPDHAPFDGILVAAAPDHVPQALTEQLAVGAKLVIPVGPQIRGQDLLVITRTDAGLEHATIAPVRFVPMTGEAQDPNAR